jgi:hypothetical protein
MKARAVARKEDAECRLTDPHRLLEHGIEDRSEVAGRAVDDLQHLGGCGLSLQRLAFCRRLSLQAPQAVMAVEAASAKVRS